MCCKPAACIPKMKLDKVSVWYLPRSVLIENADKT